MVTPEMIDKLTIFKKLDKQDVEKILEFCTVEDFQQGERLFCEGDPATDMWIVIDGGVNLRFEMPSAAPSTNETTISSHHKDEPESQVFGWSCFIPPNKMRLSAYCESRRCKVVKIDSSRLTRLMDSEPAIGYKIMGYLLQVVGYRFKQMQDEVAKFIGINMMNSW